MTIYNQFIDSLASGRPPDPDRVGKVCAELRKDLQRELDDAICGRRHPARLRLGARAGG